MSAAGKAGGLLILLVTAVWLGGMVRGFGLLRIRISLVLPRLRRLTTLAVLAILAWSSPLPSSVNDMEEASSPSKWANPSSSGSTQCAT